MGTIRLIHATFGERILPLLIVVVAIWLTVTWRADVRAGVPARLFAVLVDLQVTLGLIFFVYGLVVGPEVRARFLSFPFLLHPILGLLAAGVAHMAVKPDGPARRLGRWGPLVVLAVLLVIVMGNVFLARAT
jgi:hypothetical protein